MAIEAAKATDVPQKPAKNDSHPSATLHKEAISDLSSKSKKGSENPVSHPTKKETNATDSNKTAQVKHETPKVEHSKVAEQKAETGKITENKASEAKGDKSDKSNKIEKKDKSEEKPLTDKANLTPELKTAVEKANKVIVKMPPHAAENSDVVIKADGKIQHSLNMDPKKVESKDLTVAFEAKEGTTLTNEQSKALKAITDYAELHKKDLAVDASAETAVQPKASVPDNEKTQTAESEKDKAKSQAPKNQEKPVENNASETPRVNHSQAETSSRASEDGGNITHRRSSSNNSYTPQASENYSARSYSGDTASDTNFAPPQSIEQPPMTLGQILMDWFNSDPEKFKALMPDLYKLVAGADGKIDPSKLQKLQDSNDPSISKIKENLAQLAPEFPKSNAFNSGSPAASADAVNATGAALAEKAAQVSNELGTAGYCAKGVSTAIERTTGRSITGNANDMRETLPNNGFQEASSKELKVGQIVHVFWTPEVYAQERAKRGNCPNYGDIAVIGKGKDGQLYAFNDHSTPLNDYLGKSRYDWNTLKVFNPPTTA